MAEGVELASAYISLIPSLKGAKKVIEGELPKEMPDTTSDGDKGGRNYAGGFLGAVAAVGLGAGVASLISGSVAQASDLTETVSKVSVIFGDNAKAIQSWAGTAAENLGLSTQEALASAAGFGDLFTQIGFTGDQSADMSQSVVQMAADLGSFNNLPTADVVDSITGAFRGEYDSLQALIPNISDARVTTEALAMTGKENADALTAQDKAAAVLAIVTADGARAMGDFDRTSDGLANSSKTLTANYEDLQAKIGQALLPVMERIVAVGTKVVDFFSENTSVLAAVAAFIGTILVGAFIAWAVSIWATTVALLANPITWIVLGIAALIAGLILLIANWDAVVAFLRGAWQAVTSWLAGLWEGMKQTFTAAWGAVVDFFKKIPGWLLNAFLNFTLPGLLIKYWDDIVRTAKGAWDGLIGWFQGIPGRIADFASGLWNPIWTSFKGALNSIIRAWNDFQLTIGGGNILGVDIPSVTLNTPNIPMLARGGVVTGPTLAMIGEAGAEAVVPLDRAGEFGFGRGLQIENFYAGGLSVAQVGDEIAWRLSR